MLKKWLHRVKTYHPDTLKILTDWSCICPLVIHLSELGTNLPYAFAPCTIVGNVAELYFAQEHSNNFVLNEVTRLVAYIYCTLPREPTLNPPNCWLQSRLEWNSQYGAHQFASLSLWIWKEEEINPYLVSAVSEKNTPPLSNSSLSPSLRIVPMLSSGVPYHNK